MRISKHFIYIQDETKLNCIEIKEGWGWLSETTIIDCNCKGMGSWLVTNKKGLDIATGNQKPWIEGHAMA